MSSGTLLRGRRFAPLLLTGFLGAMNDNILRAAVIVVAAMTATGDAAATLALLAGAALSLPFVLFSGLAGTMADRFEKAGMIRRVKLFELLIAAGAALSLVWGHLYGALAAIFAMGVQSAFFGPLKQGWLPERLTRDELVRANAWMEGATFMAILTGTVGGGLLVALAGPASAALAVLVVAAGGVLSSRLLPRGRAAAPELRLPLNPLAGNLRLLRALGHDRDIRNATILECWFWSVGALCLSTLPLFLKTQLGAGELLVTAVMAIFAAGIGIGSALAGRLLKGVISVWPVAPAAAVVAAASALLYAGLHLLPVGGGALALGTTAGGLMVSVAILAVAIGGGMYVVPLAALVQNRARPDARARTVAGIAIATSLSVAATTVLVSLLVSWGLPVREVFLITLLGSLGIACLVWRFFPRQSLQGFVRILLTLWFRVKIEGAEHLETEGPVVFAPNHLSLIDGPLLFALISRRTSFAMTGRWAGTPLLRRISRFVPIASMDATSPMSAKTLVNDIRSGTACVVFPEGRLSATGSLMKMYPGTAWIVDQAAAPVVPVHFEGPEFSRWARFKERYPRLLAPKVRIVVGAPRALHVDPALRGRQRREAAMLALGDLLEAHRQSAIDRHESLPQALAETARIFGRGRHAIADPLGTSLTHGRIVIGADALARVLRPLLPAQEHLGILLPTSAGMPVILTALWRLRVVPAMMNHTVGHGPALQALRVAGVHHVLTSRAMVAQAKLETMIERLETAGVQILWIEDLRGTVGRTHKLRAVVSARCGRARTGRSIRGRGAIARTDAAVILFTSGTEGTPKGVVLSHGNLLANAAQLRARTDINAADRMFSALPLFHSLGLTGGLILPLLCAADIFAYPSPLHMKQIPEAAYIHQSTVIIGTDTFLAGWARRASRADFGTVRAAIAGAEAVKPVTRRMWMDRFGARILEGYGATECGPVISLNSANVAKEGTVGRLLPGMIARYEDVPGLPGKRLWVHGPNVMKGYLLDTHPGRIVPPADGWYDTGDVVTVDEDGFITITGRVKRFAKVGGEMVSLSAVEALAARTWPGLPLAAIALPDERKGNRVILCVAPADDTVPSRDALQAVARDEGVAEIMLPAAIEIVPAIPLLASGKTDYPRLTGLVEAGGGRAASAEPAVL